MRSSSRNVPVVRAAVVAVVVAVVLGLASAAPAHAASLRWVGGWAASPMGVGSNSTYPSGFADRTVRNVVRLATGGSELRFRISNEWGSKPLRINDAEVARRTSGAAVDAASRQRIRFGGASGVTVPVGASVLTDPVPFRVSAGTDLAVSLYAPDPTGRPTWHYSANAASYTSSGNRVDQSTSTGFATISSWYFLTAVQVRTTEDLGTVVAFGDSITEGARSTFDANRRYPDRLAARLTGLADGAELSVVNAGIGSNRLLTDNYLSSRHMRSGLSRFAADVLAQPNLRSVVMLMGTNDLSVNNPDAVTHVDLINAYNTIITRARERGATVVVGTIPPGGFIREGDPGSGLRLRESVRRTMNEWIRGTDRIDTVVDFDAVLRDPADPRRIRAAYRGDEVHPNDAGYRAMADAIPLGALD